MTIWRYLRRGGSVIPGLDMTAVQFPSLNLTRLLYISKIFTKQTAAISLTASSITRGRVGVIDLQRKWKIMRSGMRHEARGTYRASSVSASLCSNKFFKPTLLFMMAFKHLIHLVKWLNKSMRVMFSVFLFWFLTRAALCPIWNRFWSIRWAPTAPAKHYFRASVNSRFKQTCFSPLLPKSWTHSRLLFVKATLKLKQNE